MRRVAAATIGISAIVVMWASPASAHPASPTNYHSVVTGIEPPVASVRADIVGGDAFVRVRSNGHEVIVVGYGGEPYLRLSRDGHVQENKASPAGLLNSDRYARVTAPTADPTAVPVWASVGGDGSLLWHDHRVHWMSPRPAPTVDGSGLVQHWELPLLIDGQPVVVQGALYRSSPPTTL